MHDDGARLHEERESEFKEETHSSLIQTGASSSLNLKSQVLGARRAKTVEKRVPV